MRTDTYTKFILSVIAICLTILVAKELVPPAKADSNSTESMVRRYGLVPVNPDGSINVNINPSSVIDVRLVDIYTNDQLDINVAKVGGYSTYGVIPVKIKE